MHASRLIGRNSQLLELHLPDCAADWVKAATLGERLAILGHNIFDELSWQQVNRLVWLFVHVNGEISRDRVLAGQGDVR